jgi:2'-5' RNA ligase
VSARLFFALELPERVRSELAAWGRTAAEADAALRPVRPDALHLTLVFLGHRALDEIEPLAEVVRAAAAPVPDLSLGDALWLSPRRPHVLTVAVADPTGALERLQAAAASGASEAVGFVPERRRFRPHVTAARVRHRAVPRRSGLPPPPRATFSGEALTLFRSHLGGRGPARHEVVERVVLDTGAPRPR